MSLWKVAIDERSGKVLSSPEPLNAPSPSMSNLTISADGTRLAFISDVSTDNVQKNGFNPVAGRAVGAPVTVTSGTRGWSSADPSPDGQWVVMQSGSPQEDIYVSRADGTGLRQLTNDKAFDRRPRWSPDGSYIAFYSNRSGTQQIWSVKPDGSELRRLTDYPGSGMLYAAWSPDASRIVAGVQPPNTRILMFDARKLWKDQTPEELEVPKGGCLPNSWSPDGLKLLCGGFVGTFVYSFKSRTYELLTDYSSSIDVSAVWLADSRRVLMERDGRLLLMDSVTKNTREVLSLPPDYLDEPHLSRDNRQIFFVREHDQSDVYTLSFK